MIHPSVILKCLKYARQVPSDIRALSTMFGLPYRSALHACRKLNLSDRWQLAVAGDLDYNADFVAFLNLLVEENTSLEAIADLLCAERTKISSVLKRAGIKVKWALEDNHNQLLASSRAAELFVAHNLGIRLIRDCYETREAGFPYDLILQGYGSVDVKSTIIKPEGDKLFAAFNVLNFKRSTKYAFLVAFDASRTVVEHVFAVPSKVAAGHSTLKVYISPMSPKYTPFLIYSKPTEE